METTQEKDHKVHKPFAVALEIGQRVRTRWGEGIIAGLLTAEESIGFGKRRYFTTVRVELDHAGIRIFLPQDVQVIESG